MKQPGRPPPKSIFPSRYKGKKSLISLWITASPVSSPSSLAAQEAGGRKVAGRIPSTALTDE